MCKAATCNTCAKRSWWGCGNHVPSVLDHIAEENRCTCFPSITVNGKAYPRKQTGRTQLKKSWKAPGQWEIAIMLTALKQAYVLRLGADDRLYNTGQFWSISQEARAFLR